MKNSLRFIKYFEQYCFFEAYEGFGLIVRHGRQTPFFWGEVNQSKSRLITLEPGDLLALSRKQKQLLQDVVTLGWGLLFLLGFNRHFDAWVKDKGITFVAGSLVYPSVEILCQEVGTYDHLLRRKNYFFEYYNDHILLRYTLSELVREIKETFSFHHFGFDFLLFEQLCLEFPTLFSAGQAKRSLLPDEEDLVRKWLLSYGNANKPLLDKHISKCGQHYDNFQRTVTLFQNRLGMPPWSFAMRFFRLHVKHPSGLTTVQIKAIMARLHAYLKKAGPVTYARKVSYDCLLGLQVDLVLGLEAGGSSKIMSQRDLSNEWSSVVDKVLGMGEGEVFYIEEEGVMKTPQDVMAFLQSVWRRSCFLDSHIKLHVPLLHNFTTSRS